MSEYQSTTPERILNSPTDIANKLVTQWEADIVFKGELDENESPETKSLGRMVLDCLADERPNKNELEMLNLVKALTEKITNATLTNEQAKRETQEALKHLADAYEEYQSITKI